MDWSRRSFLGIAAATGSASALAALVGFMPQAGPKDRKKKPKNIIYCVADGMAMAAVTMADAYQKLMGKPGSYWSALMENELVVTGLQDTRSLSSVVTDSSAAASAWGSGRRIWNGQVNIFPDGTKLRPIADIVKAAGMRTGLVTTTTMTHATPSGFSVSMENRGWEDLIAEAHLKSGVDVLFGGGDRFFDGTKRKNRTNLAPGARKIDLYDEFAKIGYQVVKNRTQLAQLKSGKALGIFFDSHLPFTVDRDHDSALASTPTLAEMAAKAIDLLKGGPEGFLLQIEGGRVDHAAHGNDLAGLVFDQIAFEEAVKVAIEFAMKDGETLVVITSDHACGGPSLNGSGSEDFPMAYFDSTAGLGMLAGMKSSYGPILGKVGANPSVADVQGAVETYLGIKLKKSEALAVVSAMVDQSPFATSQFYGSAGGTLAMVLGNYTKVTWTSGNHTNDHVLLSAFGPGSHLFHGMTKNFEVFDILLGLRGLSHKNPTMTFEEAMKHVDRRFRNKVAAIDGGDCCECEEYAVNHVHAHAR